MASAIEICNLALLQVGANSISSLDSATKESRTCNALYATLRDEVLSDNDWGFARKRLTLAEVDATYSGWGYTYQIPTDCLVPRRITNLASDQPLDKIPHEIITNSTKDKKYLLTNEVDAELVYTARVTDPNMFEVLFIKALAFRIAADLSQPLRGKLDLRGTMLQAYSQTLSKGEAISNNQGHKEVDDSNVFTRSR